MVELIIDILEESLVPLKQGKILQLAENHPAYEYCGELHRVEVPLSAVARCLTKYSSGSNPVFGVADEGKVKKSQKRFFLKTKNIPEVKNIPESSLHPYLVKFAHERFNVYSKTINSLKVAKKKDKIGRWTNPDIVGVSPALLNLSRCFKKKLKN